MKFNKLIFLVGLAATALLILYFLLMTKSEKQSEQTKYSYSLNYLSQGTQFANKALPGAPTSDQDFSFVLESQLYLEKIPSDNSSTKLFRFKIIPSKWIADGFSTKLDRPEYLEGEIIIDEAFKIIEFSLDDSQIAMYGNVVVDISSLLTADLRREEKSWQSQMTHSGATFLYNWKRLEESSFEKSLSFKNDSLDIREKGSYIMEPNNVIWKTVHVVRDRAYNFNGNPVSKDSTTLSLERNQISVSSFPKIQPNSDKLVPETPEGSLSQKNQKQKIYERILSNYGADELLHELSEINSGKLKDSIALYEKVKAFFWLYPDDVDVFKELCKNYDLRDLRCSHVLTAATTIGHEKAQSFLRELLFELSDKPEKQNQIIPHLSMTATPTKETEDMLRNLSQTAQVPIRTTANLGLGTIAHQLRYSQTERSLAIFYEQVQNLEKAADNREIEHYIRVLGNIGINDQFLILQPYLNHSDNRIKLTAIHALRHVQLYEAREKLIEILVTDSSAEVRHMAADALRFAPAGREQLVKVMNYLPKETDVDVIKMITQFIVQNIGHKDEIFQALTNYVESCAHPDLCSYLHGLINSHGSRN